MATQQERLLYQDPKYFLDTVACFYSNPASPEVIYDQALTVTELVTQSNLPVAGIGIWGFPSYLGTNRLPVIPVEYLSYINKLKNKIPEQYSNPCPDCYRANNLTDVRSMCDSCQASLFKPRDMQKVSPDVDMFFVINTPGNPAPAVNQITENIKAQGITPSDYDIGSSMTQIIEACRQNNTFPIDSHFLNLTDVASWSEGFSLQDPNTWKIPQLSWYGPNLVLDEKYMGPGTVLTTLWTGISAEVLSYIRKVNQKIIDGTLPRLDQPGTANMARFLLSGILEGSPTLRGLAEQPELLQRMEKRIMENLLF